MKREFSIPKTLAEAICYFADPEVAFEFMVALRWPNGVTCPRCESDKVKFLPKWHRWQCNGCRQQFTVKVGTIFEDSPLGLDKWLPALWLIGNCKNGVSSYEIGRALGVTQKTAWFMLHRIRLAMQGEGFDKFGGSVEADETFIGGRARFMHQNKRKRVIKGTGGLGKVAVMGLLNRHGKGHSTVRVSVVPDRTAGTLHARIRQNVKAGSKLYTDAHTGYEGLDAEYIHGVIDHSESYVKGQIHTNGLENFWSLLKRALKGTYVSVEPFHLFRYLDEQVFRFNNRKDNDAGRFESMASNVIGKRVTYKVLTGANLPETC